MKIASVLLVSALVTTASLAAAGARPSAAVPSRAGDSTELSSAKRKYHGQPPRRAPRVAQYPTPRYSSYLRGPDPSLGPDGRPYPVPAHLRGQCYIDDGYGRFSACPNR